MAANLNNSQSLLAGVGRVNITPSLGVDLMGTSRRWAPAKGVHQELYATCLVLSTGAASIALVDTDLLAIPNPTAREWRERIGAVIGAEAGHVLLACTHNHTGPATSPHMPKIGGEQTRFRPEELTYIDHLGYKLESAAKIAMANLQPARLAAGVGRVNMTVNRREEFEDGQTLIGRNFDRPIDSDVGVLRVDTEAGQPLAAVINFTSHPTITPRCELISPDFPGATRHMFEEITGAIPLYFTGAAGDIVPLKNYLDEPYKAELLGRQLGCEAAHAYYGLNPQPTETKRTFLWSVSKLCIYEDIPVERPPITHFGAATRQLELDLQPPPSLAEAEQILAEKRSRIRELKATAADRATLNPAIYQELWARKLVDSLKDGTIRRTAQAEIQAIRLDDIALVAVPGEAFVKMALLVKEKSPFKHTFFIAYANGAIGYIPMREDYPKGGYEVTDAFKGYGYPAALAPGSAERIVDTCLELLHELAQTEQPE